MPTYGYRCTSCGTEFDVWQRMTDEPGAECPSCGAAATRLFYPAGIVFKGSGFYKTDSRGSSSSSVPPSTSSGSASGSTGATGGDSGTNTSASSTSSTDS